VPFFSVIRFHLFHVGIFYCLQELHAHVEQGLGRNLQARCSSALREEIERTEKEMDRKRCHSACLRALLHEQRTYALRPLRICCALSLFLGFMVQCQVSCLSFRILASTGAGGQTRAGCDFDAQQQFCRRVPARLPKFVRRFSRRY